MIPGSLLSSKAVGNDLYYLFSGPSRFFFFFCMFVGLHIQTLHEKETSVAVRGTATVVQTCLNITFLLKFQMCFVALVHLPFQPLMFGTGRSMVSRSTKYQRVKNIVKRY